MDALKHPVNFICKTEILWPELAGGDVPEISGQRLSDLSGGITHSWVIRTYYELSRRGHGVSISDEMRPGHINIAGARDFGRRDARADGFLVVARGDAHLPMLADFVIEQNEANRGKPGRLAVSHWPQPGIIPRDAGREPKIRALTFKGRRPGLQRRFRSEAFIGQLNLRGITFEVDDYEGLRGDHRWNDYSQADAVLAVRNPTRYQSQRKTASKLVNAWLAGVVPILGPEPAYRELRRSALDYVEVTSPTQALQEIDRLNADPDALKMIFENAAARAVEFSNDRVAAEWLAALNGPVARAYEAWRHRPLPVRKATLLMRFLAEPVSKRLNRARAELGPRILDLDE